MTDRDHAARAAQAFVDRTVAQVRAILEPHAAVVADFACVMQERLDRAEGLLAEIAAERRTNPDLLRRIDALLTEAKARSR